MLYMSECRLYLELSHAPVNGRIRVICVNHRGLDNGISQQFRNSLDRNSEHMHDVAKVCRTRCVCSRLPKLIFFASNLNSY